MGSNGGRNWLNRCPRAFSEPRLHRCVSSAARSFPFLALLSNPPLPPPRRGAYGSPTASLPHDGMALESLATLDPAIYGQPPWTWTAHVAPRYTPIPSEICNSQNNSLRKNYVGRSPQRQKCVRGWPVAVFYYSQGRKANCKSSCIRAYCISNSNG